MIAFLLANLGRGARGGAAAGLGLLLLALAFQADLYSQLTVAPSPAAARPIAVAQPAPAGQAVTLGDTRWGFGRDTYCEQYVEQRFNLGNQGATAYAAYLRLAGLGLVHPGPPPEPDDLVYFGPAPANQFDGHVGVYDGGGRFTSVTFSGVQQYPLAGWDAPYLGWVWPGDIRSDRFGAPVAPSA